MPDHAVCLTYRQHIYIKAYTQQSHINRAHDMSRTLISKMDRVDCDVLWMRVCGVCVCVSVLQVVAGGVWRAVRFDVRSRPISCITALFRSILYSVCVYGLSLIHISEPTRPY